MRAGAVLLCWCALLLGSTSTTTLTTAARVKAQTRAISGAGSAAASRRGQGVHLPRWFLRAERLPTTRAEAAAIENASGPDPLPPQPISRHHAFISGVFHTRLLPAHQRWLRAHHTPADKARFAAMRVDVNYTADHGISTQFNNTDMRKEAERKNALVQSLLSAARFSAADLSATAYHHLGTYARDDGIPAGTTQPEPPTYLLPLAPAGWGGPAVVGSEEESSESSDGTNDDENASQTGPGGSGGDGGGAGAGDAAGGTPNQARFAEWDGG